MEQVWNREIRKTQLTMADRAVLSVFIVLSILGFWLAYRIQSNVEEERRLNLECKQWPSVTGRILKSQVVYHKARKNSYSTLDVEYEYEVGSQKYTGHKLAYGFRGQYLVMGSDIPALKQQYNTGMQINVYYDPADPGEAVLSRDGIVQPLTDLDNVIFMLAIGIGMLIAAAKIYREKTRTVIVISKAVSSVPDLKRWE
jgi:hypothetical protein